MRKLLLTSALAATSAFSFVSSASAAPALNPGDIAIIGVSADSPETVVMVATVNIDAGITLYLTDNGWQASGSFRSGEGTDMFTTAGYTAGQVFTVELSSPALANSGDQVFLYQGSLVMGVPSVGFIAGANFGNDGWASDATNANTSAIPPALAGAYTTGPANKENFAYSGPTMISRADFLTLIASGMSFTGDNSMLPSYPSSIMFGAFAIDGGVGPDASMGGGADAGVPDSGGMGSMDAGGSMGTAVTLNTGDIAVIGAYTDDPDTVIMVAMVDIAGGEQFNITDNGWKNTGGFRTGEGVATFTVPHGGYAAGDVFTYTPSGSGAPNLASGGDQIFIYQGTVASGALTGRLIWGANLSSSGWSTDATNSNTSALPTELTMYNTLGPNKDNFAYSGPTMISVDDLRMLLRTGMSLTGDETVLVSYPSSFTFGAFLIDGGTTSADASTPRDATITVDGTVEATPDADVVIDEDGSVEDPEDGSVVVTPTPDGSTPATPDAGGARADSGVRTSSKSGGCSTSGGSSNGLPFALMMIAGAFVLRRRR